MTQSCLRTLGLVAAILIVPARRAAAGTDAAPPVGTNVTGQAASGDLDNLSKGEILKLIRNLADELKQTRSELEQLKASRPDQKPPAIPPVGPAVPVPPPAPPAPAEATKEPTEAEKDRERVERERAIQSVQQSGVLLPKGKFDVEPSFTYSHTSLNFINVNGFSILPVLVIGDIQSLRVERDTFQTALALRYGIRPNL